MNERKTCYFNCGVTYCRFVFSSFHRMFRLSFVAHPSVRAGRVLPHSTKRTLQWQRTRR